MGHLISFNSSFGKPQIWQFIMLYYKQDPFLFYNINQTAEIYTFLFSLKKKLLKIGIKLRTLCLPGKFVDAELYSQPQMFPFYSQFSKFLSKMHFSNKNSVKLFLNLFLPTLVRRNKKQSQQWVSYSNNISPDHILPRTRVFFSFFNWKTANPNTETFILKTLCSPL